MSQFISLQQAIEMTTLYRLEKENILAVPFKNQNILCKSETFARDVFDSVLAQPGCTGLRVYYGMDPTFKVHAIIVGVNNNNEDILPSVLSTPGTARSMSLTGGDEGIIETGNRCPDDCPPESDLNG